MSDKVEFIALLENILKIFYFLENLSYNLFYFQLSYEFYTLHPVMYVCIGLKLSNRGAAT